MYSLPPNGHWRNCVRSFVPAVIHAVSILQKAFASVKLPVLSSRRNDLLGSSMRAQRGRGSGGRGGRLEVRPSAEQPKAPKLDSSGGLGPGQGRPASTRCGRASASASWTSTGLDESGRTKGPAAQSGLQTSYMQPIITSHHIQHQKLSNGESGCRGRGRGVGHPNPLCRNESLATPALVTCLKNMQPL